MHCSQAVPRAIPAPYVHVKCTPKVPQTGTRTRASKQEPDLIESLFGKLFGKKALEDPEPFGLKRINFADLPDQFVVLDRDAAPVDSDTGLAAAVRPLLAGTQLEKVPLRLAYSAADHGWLSQAFHERVDSYGAAVVVAETQGGAVIGGYNPEGWISLGEDRASNGAFLFTWPDGDTSKPAFKLPKVGGPNLAVIDKPDAGPQFGAEGLSMPLRPLRGDPDSERLAKCRLGTYYERLPQGGRTLFAQGEDPKRTQLRLLEVYVAAGDGVTWELDGIVWKSKVGES